MGTKEQSDNTKSLKFMQRRYFKKVQRDTKYYNDLNVTLKPLANIYILDIPNFYNMLILSSLPHTHGMKVELS